MKKSLWSLAILLFLLFSFSSVSYAEVVKSDDGKSYIVTGENDTLSYDVLSGDLYILKGCTLTTSNQVSIFGNVYVFGTLNNTGTLRISGNLYCLRFIGGGITSVIGSYDYGHVTSTGKFYVNDIVVKTNYLTNPIPSYDGTNVPEQHTHTWVKDHSFKSNCKDTGLVSYRCSECGKTENRTVGPEDHVLTEWAYSAPTCIVSGFRISHCSECNYSEEVKLPATGVHTYGNWSIVQPTCSTNGYRSRQCTECGLSDWVALPATGVHTYSNWIATEAATAYVAGKESRSCSVCGHTESRTTAKLSKKFSKDEKNVKKATDAFFKYARKYDINKMRKCFATPKKVKLFASKKNVAKYIRKHNKDLWYEIRNIKVSKKSATVTVACNYYNAYEAVTESLDDAMYYMASKKRSNSAVDKYQYKRLTYYDNYMADYTDSTFTIKLKKVGKNWKLTNPSRALYNAIHCNYNSAYDDFF